jgi:hypothetical protein
MDALTIKESLSLLQDPTDAEDAILTEWLEICETEDQND